MKLSRISFLTLVGLLSLLVTPRAEAWVWINECRGPVLWGGSTITMEPSVPDFPAGTNLRAAVDRMRNAWNAEAPGSVVQFNYNFNNTDGFAENDGRNSIVIATAAEWTFGARTLAVTIPRLSTNRCWWWPFARPRIVEKDVVFNPTPDGSFWDLATNPAPPHPNGPFNMPLVGIHEFGHVFGLDHENDLMSTLDEFYENGGVIGNFNETQPHADDIAGSRSGYGSAGTQRDVSASAFRRIGGGDSAPIPAPATALRNSPVGFNFTIENRGNTNQSSVRVQFYLSTNRFISTGDTFLGTSTFSMNAGTVATRFITVTIPGNVAPGAYHLGWIVDPLGTIGEVDEGNNAVGLVDQTTILANAAPTACCTVNPDVGYAPLSVNFNASCSSDPNGDPLTYAWDFDDGTTGTGVSPSHTFWDNGFFDVLLTVTDSTGLSDTEECTVEVFCSEEPCEV